jgi:exosome complex component RRP43
MFISEEMDAGVFKRVQPVAYYRHFIDQDVRPDGRLFSDVRQTTVTVGAIETADGSSMVRMGNTTVVCGIKVQVALPHPLTPTKGYIVPNVELSPLCSSRFKVGPPSELAQVTSEWLHQMVQHVVNVEDLCIERGKAVWVIYADVTCLNYDGNVLDAAQLALVAALRNSTSIVDN